MYMRGGRVCKWNDFRFSFNPSSSFFFLKNYCPTGTDFLSVLINFFFLLVFFNFPSTFWFQPCSPGIDRTYELIILNKVESVFFSNAIFFFVYYWSNTVSFECLSTTVCQRTRLDWTGPLSIWFRQEVKPEWFWGKSIKVILIRQIKNIFCN